MKTIKKPTWQPVYALVKKIPRGRATTYGEVARALRLRGGARAAGYAMAACPANQGIPWHRVLGAGGRLLIREPHANLQRRLLQTEGVIGDERSVDMKRFGWTFKAKTAKRKIKRRKARRSVIKSRM